MALTQENRRKLEDLALEKGGLFPQAELFGDMPVLFVGLGGLGVRTLQVIRRNIQGREGAAEKAFFLAIDSDEHDLQAYRDGIHVADAGMNEVISIFAPGIVPGLFGPNGAGGIRKNGRLLLTAGHKYEAIQNYLSGCVMRIESILHGMGKFQVILISGTGGGTGGGIVVDVAYIIRNAMMHLGVAADRYLLQGFLFLPDVMSGIPGLMMDFAQRKMIAANGYAALKEIDYYLQPLAEREPYVLELLGQTVTSEAAVLDQCKLISGKTAAGNFRSTERTVQMVGDCLAELTAEIHMPPGNEMPLQYLSGNGYQMLLFEKKEIPEREVLTWTASQIWQQMMEAWSVQGHQLEQAGRHVLAGILMNDGPSLMNFALHRLGYDGQAFRAEAIEAEPFPTRAQLLDDPEYGLRRSAEVAEVWRGRILRRLPELETDIRTIIRERLNNCLDRGPFFVAALLDGNRSHLYNGGERAWPGIIHFLNVMRESMNEMAQNARRRFEIERHQLPELAVRASSLFAGRAVKSAYMEECCNIAEGLIIYELLSRVMIDVLGRLQRELTEDLIIRWEPYQEIVEYVERILKDDAEAVYNAGVGIPNEDVLIDLPEATGQRIRAVLHEIANPNQVKLISHCISNSMRLHSGWWGDVRENEEFRAASEIRDIFQGYLQGSLEPQLPEKLIMISRSPGHLDVQQVNNEWNMNGTVRHNALQQAADEIIAAFSGTMAALLPGGVTQKMLFLAPASTPDLTSRVTVLLPPDTLRGVYMGGAPRYTLAGIRYPVAFSTIPDIEEYARFYQQEPTMPGLHPDEETQRWHDYHPSGMSV